jgi:hypothetical protein
MGEQRKTVSVTSRLGNAVILRRFQMVDGDIPGSKVARPIGDGVQIAPGLNQGIDAEFYSAWLEQNKEHNILATERWITATPENAEANAGAD